MIRISKNSLFANSIILNIIALFISTDCYSQNRTFIHYEGGLIKNYGNWNSNLANFNSSLNIQPNVGFYFEQEIGKHFSIEIGVNDYFTEFDALGNLNDTTKIDFCSYAQYVQIPLRVKAKINLIGNKLFITPLIGAGFTFKGYDGIDFYDGSTQRSRWQKPLNYEYEINSSYPKSTIILQSGLTIEYIRKLWKFGFISTYNLNPNKSINYSTKELQTEFKSKGNYSTYQIRIGYAISNIWNRSKQK